MRWLIEHFSSSCPQRDDFNLKLIPDEELREFRREVKRQRWFYMSGKTEVYFGKFHTECRRNGQPWEIHPFLLVYTEPRVGGIYDWCILSPSFFAMALLTMMFKGYYNNEGVMHFSSELVIPQFGSDGIGDTDLGLDFCHEFFGGLTSDEGDAIVKSLPYYLRPYFEACATFQPPRDLCKEMLEEYRQKEAQQEKTQPAPQPYVLENEE